MESRFAKRRAARRRWSLNAVHAKERKRIERATEPIAIEPAGNVFVPKRPRFDLRVILERRDGMKIQFTLHHFYGKLIGRSVNLSPKQFGRKLGDIFAVWMKE